MAKSRWPNQWQSKGIGVRMASSCLFPQWAGMFGFQLCVTGMQTRVSARKVPIHQKTTTVPSIQVHIRNARVMNIRWKSINTEILVTASNVGCSSPTVNHSYCSQYHHLATCCRVMTSRSDALSQSQRAVPDLKSIHADLNQKLALLICGQQILYT